MPNLYRKEKKKMKKNKFPPGWDEERVNTVFA